MNKKKVMLNVLLVVCILVFVGSGVYLFRYYYVAHETQNELDELIALKEEGQQEADAGTDTVEQSGQRRKKMLKEFKKLYSRNKDICGWLQVENTKIDYPVMFTPEDSEYYLHRNFKKEQDVNGLPFLDAKCDTEDVHNNLVVYGHHMKSGMMFAHLMDFEKKDFYEKHKIINFDTLYEKRQYEVVAAFYSKVYKNEEDVFKYYNYPGKLDKKQYANYVKNCRKLSVYDTGVTPSYGEQLLTLVTCAYQTEEGRFVVVARRI